MLEGEYEHLANLISDRVFGHSYYSEFYRNPRGFAELRVMSEYCTRRRTHLDLGSLYPLAVRTMSLHMDVVEANLIACWPSRIHWVVGTSAYLVQCRRGELRRYTESGAAYAIDRVHEFYKAPHFTEVEFIRILFESFSMLSRLVPRN